MMEALDINCFGIAAVITWMLQRRRRSATSSILSTNGIREPIHATPSSLPVNDVVACSGLIPHPEGSFLSKRIVLVLSRYKVAASPTSRARCSQQRERVH